MKRGDIAWRGFVTHDGEIIAWPTLLSEHNFFHGTFRTTDADFAARWRQWEPGERVSFDPGATPEAKAAVEAWLNA